MPKEKEKYSEKIRAESDKSTVDLSRASSVVQNNAELEEYPTGEGTQKTAAKYTEQ